MDWQLAEAKNRFSEVMTQALTKGPQRVHRRNQAVIILSEADYQRLTGEKPSLKQYILTGPDLSGVDLERDSSPMRSVDW